jgi:SAM-dependent methyltransferase
MNPNVCRRFITLFVIGVLAAADLRAQSARENAADAEWLIKALEIRPGSLVGEIGAGDGTLTCAMAREVGDSGRVFTNELNKDRVKAIEREAGKAGLKNVTVVEGRELETNFPDQCCDAIFMRNVYHHFGDPPADRHEAAGPRLLGGATGDGQRGRPGHRLHHDPARLPLAAVLEHLDERR